MKRLYMVHCGYYDPSVGHGLFENHTNFFVCAEDFDDARAQARQSPEFRRLKMRVNGGATRTRSLKYGSRTPKLHES